MPRGVAFTTTSLRATSSSTAASATARPAGTSAVAPAGAGPGRAAGGGAPRARRDRERDVHPVEPEGAVGGVVDGRRPRVGDRLADDPGDGGVPGEGHRHKRPFRRARAMLWSCSRNVVEKASLPVASEIT